jgi:hypothetical protein
LNSGPSLEPLHPALFLWRVFSRDRVSRNYCSGWLWTTILLISASWVARITDIESAVIGSKIEVQDQPGQIAQETPSPK